MDKTIERLLAGKDLRVAKEYELLNEDARDIAFTGWLLGSGSSKDHNSIRWREADIYLTKGGKLVAHVIGKTRMQGERDRHTVHIAESAEELVDKAGVGWVEKEAYDNAGIPHVMNID